MNTSDELKFLADASRKYPLLTADQEKELSRAVREGGVKGERAREKIYNSNIRLVMMVARKYVRYDVPIGDLVQEGSLGLLRAISKFEPDRGVRFATYAMWWVRQAMIGYIADHGLIRIPRYVGDARYQLKKAERAYGEVSDEECVMSLRQIFSVRELRLLPEAGVSLDHKVSEDSATTLGEMVPSEDPDLEEDFIRRALIEEIIEFVLSGETGLCERDRAILVRCGVFGEKYSDLAREMDLSRERVRQVCERGVRILRRQFKPPTNENGV